MDSVRLNVVLLSVPQQSVMCACSWETRPPRSLGPRSGEGGTKGALRPSDWGKTAFSKENSSKKAEKYLVEIPFFP